MEEIQFELPHALNQADYYCLVATKDRNKWWKNSSKHLEWNQSERKVY